MSLRKLFLAALFLMAMITGWAQVTISPSPSFFQANELFVNSQYSYFFTAADSTCGSECGYTWSFSTLTPAPGLTLDAAEGGLFGTPTQAGVFIFSATASFPATNHSLTQQYVLFISAGALGIKETAIPAAQQGQAYSTTLTPQGGVPPYRQCAFSGGTNSDGLGIGLDSTATLCQITGTPTTAGSFTIGVIFQDQFGSVLNPPAQFTLAVNGNISITTTTLPNGELTVPYGGANGVTIQETGGAAPFTWAVSAGALPGGLQLNTSTGAITGTPTATGTFSFTISVSYTPAGANAPITASQAYSVQIFAALSTSPLTVTGNVNQAITPQTPTVSGGSTPYSFAVTSGSLPSGLQISATNGQISGTPTAAANISITVTVTDSLGATATIQVTVNISSPVVPTVTIGLTNGPPNTQQTGPTVTLGSAATSNLTGTLTLTFTSNTIPGTSVDDKNVQFVSSSGGTRSLTITIPSGATSASIPTDVKLATGTTAGTITVTLTALTDANNNNILPSPAPTKSINIAQNPPVITSITCTFSSSASTITVTAIGFSPTREMVNGAFTFSASTSATLASSSFTVNLASAFTGYYTTPSSQNTGTQFKLTMPFTFSSTGGTSSAPVNAVLLTLTNSNPGSPNSPSASGACSPQQ